jgi:hypothetical protein
MWAKSISVITPLLLLSAVPVTARIRCRSLACPTAGVVDAARDIVERECPCAAQTSAKRYAKCVKRALATAKQELGASLTGPCINDVKVAIHESTCGRSDVVPCNKRNKKDTKTSCSIVSTTECSGSACGAFTSCVDACNRAGEACAAPRTTTTTVLGGSPTSTTASGGTSTSTTTIVGGSTTSSTTTLVGGGSTTSTSATNTTTTTLAATYSCSIATADCTATSCTCGPDPGLDYHISATGSVSGPVGTQLRVNINAPQGGTIDCGSWTRVYGNVITGCDTIGCCLREDGAPETVQWSVFEAIDLPCSCPGIPPGQHNFLIQCQLPPYPVIEHEQTSTPCP